MDSLLSVVALGHRVSTRNGTNSGGAYQWRSRAAPRTRQFQPDHVIAAAAERLRSTSARQSSRRNWTTRRYGATGGVVDALRRRFGRIPLLWVLSSVVVVHVVALDEGAGARAARAEAALRRRRVVVVERVGHDAR